MIHGVGEYFDEPFEIEEQACMQNGSDRCEIVVTRGDTP